MTGETADNGAAEMADAGGAKPLHKRPLFWLIVVTGIWCAIVLAIVMKRDQCGDTDVPLIFEGLFGLHRYYLACRSLNEFGDFLAGVFAPLALIWVAGAVYIQSQELAAQRKELELARDEARQTRVVMREQAAESRAATGFIGKQTEIMEQRQEADFALLSAKVFGDALSNFFSHATMRNGLQIFAAVSDVESGGQHRRSFNLLRSDLPDNMNERVSEALLKATEIRSKDLRPSETSNMAVSDVSVEWLRHCIEGLGLIVKRQAQLSPVYAAHYVMLPLTHVLSEWQGILEIIEKLPRTPERP